MMEINIDIPDSASGDWRIETFEISKADADFANMRAMFSFSSRGQFVKPGIYKRLMRNRTVVMSNTPSEISDHATFIYKARREGGSILINGLGIGMCLKAILESQQVTDVTVVELSKDVIDLVGSHFADDSRVNIHLANAFYFNPPKGKRYTCVWHDIWDNICEDNLPEMHKLHRKYGKRCDWQGSWGRPQIEEMRRRHR